MSTAGADNFADATPIADGDTSSPTPNAGLTAEAGESAPADGLTAWWQFTPATSGLVRFDTWASTPANADTVLTIYTGGPTVAGLTQVAQNDNTDWVLSSSRIFLDVTAGTTYYIQVDGYGSSLSYVLGVQSVALVDIRPSSGVGGPIFSNPHGITYQDPTVVGAAPQWSDDSDATYATIYSRGNGANAGDFVGQASATFDALPGALDIYGVSVRGVVEPGYSGNEYQFGLGDTASPGNDNDSLSGAVALPASPGWADAFAVPLVDQRANANHLDAAVAALTAGRLYMAVQAELGSFYPYPAAPAPENGIRVFEVKLTIAVPGTTPPPATVAPPLRQWPRSDGLGASSARRLWPLSPSIQASNRKVGGYL